MAKEQCSDIFREAFNSHTGGICRDCVCGRVHFNSEDASDFDEGELEELMEKAKAQPGKYIERDHTVSTMEINGIEIVNGCACDSAQKYEQLFIREAAQIAEYLNNRASALRAKADAIQVKV